MNHVQGTGKRHLDPSLQKVHQRSTEVEASGKRTEDKIENGTEHSDRPADDKKNKQPEQSPTKSTAACHLYLRSEYKVILDTIHLRLTRRTAALLEIRG